MTAIINVIVDDTTEVGPQGIQGPTGPIGIRGLPGEQGPEGPPGASGSSTIDAMLGTLSIASSDLGGGVHGAIDYFTDKELILTETSTIALIATCTLSASINFISTIKTYITASNLQSEEISTSSSLSPTTSQYRSVLSSSEVITLPSGTHDISYSLNYYAAASTTLYASLSLALIIGVNTGASTFSPIVT